MTAHDVVVCGGGVAGLALAVALGEQGRSVLLVERRRSNPDVHRGEFLQPRSLAILEGWGLLGSLRRRGAIPIEAMELRGAGGDYLGELGFHLLPQPYDHGLVHHYDRIKETLAERAHEVADIRYGVAAVGVTRDIDGRVDGVRLRGSEGEATVRTTLCVAADGRVSAVRAAAGLPARMRRYDHNLVSIDLGRLEWRRSCIIAYLSADGIRTVYPMPEDGGRLYVQIRPDQWPSIGRAGLGPWKERLFRVTPALRWIEPALPADLATAQVQTAWRYSARAWTAPGLVLVGDAAHYIHPAAGQGMNAAIADAAALAEAVDAETAGDRLTAAAADRALVAYEGRRRAQFDYVARLCHRVSTVCTATSPLVRALVGRMVRLNRDNRRLQYHVTWNVAGLETRHLTRRDRLYQLGLLRDPRAALMEPPVG